MLTPFNAGIPENPKPVIVFSHPSEGSPGALIQLLKYRIRRIPAA